MYDNNELNEVQSAFFETKAPEELYDVEQDPYETSNLAGNPEYTDELIKMRQLLAEQEIALPDLSFYPEHFLINNAFDNPVEFGQQHKHDIENYIKIAGLSLENFTAASPKIESILNSHDT